MGRSFVILCLLGILPNANAEIFKWVDEQGRVHYGDKPVTNSEQVTVDTEKKGHIKTAASREEKRQRLLDAMQEDKERTAEENKKAREKKKKHNKNCIWAKDRLKQYERASYLYDLDDKGNKIVVPQADREQMVEKLRKRIQKNCK